MTLYFESDQIKIYRQRQKGGSNRFGFSATLTVAAADIQPASLERVQASEGRIGALYQAFIDEDIDIKEGDQIAVVGSLKRYSVKGVTQWSGAGLLSHKELTLQSEDGNA